MYLRLLIFLLGVLIPACASSSLVFHIMYPAYKLNICIYIYVYKTFLLCLIKAIERTLEKNEEMEKLENINSMKWKH